LTACTAIPNRPYEKAYILDPESGLYYYGARYYDPELARFISPDPIVPSPGDPQSLNRYSYVLNNPVKYIDPTGLSFWSAIGNFFKNLFRRPERFFATLAVGLVTGGLGYLATGSFLIAGAVGGAFAGLTGSGMSGGNLWQGMLLEMVGGAVGGGVYGAVGGGLEGVLAGAFTGGFVSGGLGTAFNGGNFFQNAMVGGITSSIMAGVTYGVVQGAKWLWQKWNAMPGTPEAQASQKSLAEVRFATNTKHQPQPGETLPDCTPCADEKPQPSLGERLIQRGLDLMHTGDKVAALSMMTFVGGAMIYAGGYLMANAAAFGPAAPIAFLKGATIALGGVVIEGSAVYIGSKIFQAPPPRVPETPAK